MAHKSHHRRRRQERALININKTIAQRNRELRHADPDDTKWLKENIHRHEEVITNTMANMK